MNYDVVARVLTKLLGATGLLLLSADMAIWTHSRPRAALYFLGAGICSISGYSSHTLQVHHLSRPEFLFLIH